MHGYFFNARHWHAHRDYVLQILQVNPAVDRYLLTRYAEVALGNSVSVHVRLGYSGEPAKPLIYQRKFPPKVRISFTGAPPFLSTGGIARSNRGVKLGPKHEEVPLGSHFSGGGGSMPSGRNQSTAAPFADTARLRVA